MKILTLIGGIAKDSINKRLFELIKPLAPQDLEFETFDITKLPYFSQDMEADIPEVVKSFKEKIQSADGILFITPEYNRSIPGVLKNAIDWASRPYAKGKWKNKSTAVLGASMGPLGAYSAQLVLKQTMSFLGAYVMWQPEIYFNFSAYIDEKGGLAETSKKLYARFFESFKEWILKHQQN